MSWADLLRISALALVALVDLLLTLRVQVLLTLLLKQPFSKALQPAPEPAVGSRRWPPIPVKPLGRQGLGFGGSMADPRATGTRIRNDSTVRGSMTL
ncbi:MAG: hypothetical protein RLZZ117_292 [Cyanobacteriota bacterium]|jgi:hypothetical protein